MTDKEQLREIERKYDMWADDYNLDPQDVECLIKQAKLGIVQQEQFHDYQTKNLRLQKRVQELEGERDEWRDTSQCYYMTNQELREKSKRYREAIEFAINHLPLVKEIGQVDMVINQIMDILKGEE